MIKYSVEPICLVLSIITPSYLCGVRREALRHRIWYSVLDRVERGIIDLTIRFVDSVKSRALARQIVQILVKLRDAAKSGFTRHVEGFGVEMMWKMVRLAEGFGNRFACDWFSDSYAAWFAVNDYNNPGGWSGL